MLNWIKKLLFNKEKKVENIPITKKKTTEKYSRKTIDQCWKSVLSLLDKQGGEYRNYYDMKVTNEKGKHPVVGYKWISEDKTKEVIYFVPSNK